MFLSLFSALRKFLFYRVFKFIFCSAQVFILSVTFAPSYLIPCAGKNFTGSLPVFLLSWRYSFITYDGILISKESGARNLTVLSERISKIDISVVGSNYKLSQYYKIYFLCYGDFGGGVASRWKSHLLIYTYFSLDFKLGGELMNIICFLRFQSGGKCQCFRIFILIYVLEDVSTHRHL